MKKKRSRVSGYNKWGYIFLIPFTLAYVIFQLIPLVSTIYNSFFENYMSGLTQIGPTFVGLDNYVQLFEGGDIWIYAKNTMVLWIMCFIPQIILSLLLGAWFSDTRLRLRGSRFFKTVIYLPNLIMRQLSPCCSLHCFQTEGRSTRCSCRSDLSIRRISSSPIREAQEV